VAQSVGEGLWAVWQVGWCMCPKTGQLVLAHSARGRVSCVACNGQRL